MSKPIKPPRNSTNFKPSFGEGGGGGQDDGQFHKTALTVSWLILIDLAVIFAAIRWRKWSFWIHLIFGLTVIGLTIAAIIPQLKKYFLYRDRDEIILKIHKVTGFIVLLWLGFQTISGINSRWIQFSSRISTNLCIVVKRLHMISGYLIMILSKFNYLCLKFPSKGWKYEFILYVLAEILFLVIYIWIKFAYWTLSEQTIDSHLKTNEKKQKIKNQQCQNLQSGRKLSVTLPLKKAETLQRLKTPNIISTQVVYNSESFIPLQNYVLFNDYVYDTLGFRKDHPGGQKIINEMNKKEVNRYLYGSHSPELHSNIKPYAHSKDSIKMCGRPVARIQRDSPMKGFEDYNKVKVDYIESIQLASKTHLIHLKLTKNNRLIYEGFTKQKQIGQYYSLTISNQKERNRNTRLYTTIWCMRPQNIKFIKNSFPDFIEKNKYHKNAQIKLKMYENEIESTQSFTPEQEQIIPLMIKRYQKGSFTSRFVKVDFKGQIFISKPMGGGMKYETLSPFGKVIFICGGTGIFPFCDFIDILFKRIKYLQGHKSIISLSRSQQIITCNVIQNREFKLYYAAENQQDLSELTLYQIDALTKSENIKLECIFRIKNHSQNFTRKYFNFKIQECFFNQNIEMDLKSTEICKIYICGSPQMNESIGKVLVENKIDQEIYHFM